MFVSNISYAILLLLMKRTILISILLSSSLVHAAPGDLIFGVANTTEENRNINASDLTSNTLPALATTGDVHYVERGAVGTDGAVIASETDFSIMASRQDHGYTMSVDETQAAGLSLSDGFTMGMNYINAGANSWGVLADIRMGSMGFAILNNNATSLTVQMKLVTSESGLIGVSGLNPVSGVAQNTLTSVFVTGAYNDTKTIFYIELHVYDKAGNLIGTSGVGSFHFFNGDEPLSFQTRGYGDTRDDPNLLYANFGVWEGVASAEQMSQFAVGTAQSGFTVANFQSIPEPTSATLSVLALAGLLARRRRRRRRRRQVGNMTA